MSRQTFAYIHLPALAHNLEVLRNHAPEASFAVAIKSNAYGHGLVPVARALAASADALAVACIEEAQAIREAGVATRLLMLEGFHASDEIEWLLANNCELVIHADWQLQAIQQQAFNDTRVWIKLDTGMCRLGFKPEQFDEVYRVVSTMPGVKDVIAMTHLACADDLKDAKTAQQLAKFREAVGDRNLQLSIGNSAAVVGWPEACGDWVRPGIALYGISPFIHGVGADFQLKPVMRFESQIISVRDVKAGDAVGYGGDWIATKPTKIATVAVGYGDGYPRHAKNGTPVMVNGKQAYLAGRVSMDMICIDLGSNITAKAGDTVLLWGDELPVEVIARDANTIPYDLLCAVSQRVPRVCLES